MALRRLVLVSVLLLLLSSVGSAAILLPGPAPEQLIEGHTVFVTVGFVKNQTAEEEFAAAVAILVRDRTQTITNYRFPGVLWFNDQYLVDPEQHVRKQGPRDRFPCSGAVIAVNRGDPVDYDPLGRPTLVNASYIESYFVTDPNDHSWRVDLWNTTYDTLAWTVSIMNDDTDADKPDDGKCRGSRYTDGVRAKSPGDHGIEYPCDDCDDVEYNALLYFRLDHLRVDNASKDHREGIGDDWWADAAACHDDVTNAWICPNEDDSREGNSHPYNPDRAFPLQRYDGRDNHGGSDYCVPDGNSKDCHATFDIDIYYGYHQPPLEHERRYYLYDLVGSEAPYHCHEDNEPCDLSGFYTP